MAYNSDGYIMIDFAEVDFSKTNQTIEGLFDRCQKVIGTNKFVIVINANHKTPLPSTVCITNGQYVIESVLFTFSISSLDNLHITKKTTPEELIDDNHITLKTTYSSNKIVSELNGKQDTLTAGDNITIDNGVISSQLIKSFTYRGDGATTKTIIFDKIPKLIIIGGTIASSTIDKSLPFEWNDIFYVRYTMQGGAVSLNSYSVTYDEATKSITLLGVTAGASFNNNRVIYTVYYI